MSKRAKHQQAARLNVLRTQSAPVKAASFSWMVLAQAQTSIQPGEKSNKLRASKTSSAAQANRLTGAQLSLD